MKENLLDCQSLGRKPSGHPQAPEPGLLKLGTNCQRRWNKVCLANSPAPTGIQHIQRLPKLPRDLDTPLPSLSCSPSPGKEAQRSLCGQSTAAAAVKLSLNPCFVKPLLEEASRLCFLHQELENPPSLRWFFLELDAHDVKGSFGSLFL